MITNRIYEWAHTQPNKIALYYNNVGVSYAAFARAIEVTRRLLKRQNLPAGQTAIVLVHNLGNLWTIVMALRALGLDTIAVQSIAAAESLKIKDACCVIINESEQAQHDLNGRSLKGTPVLIIPEAIYAGINSGAIPSPIQDGPPFGGHMIYTSGTTGAYKKVMMNGANESERLAWRQKTRPMHHHTVLHVLDFKLNTGVGFNYPIMVWNAGGTVVIDQRPERYADFFKHEPTHVTLVPLMLKLLLAEKQIRRSSVDGFELVVGGGFLTLSATEQVMRDLTDNVSVGYGSSECTRILSQRFRTKEDLIWLTPAVERVVQIVDENGNECPVGKEGQLRALITPCDSTSYVDDEESSKKVFRDGYFYPGDMAVRREDGRIRILGRVQDVLNFHGEKIAVAPVEQKFQQILGIDEVCLFAGMTEDGEEELIIALETDRRPDDAAMKRIKKEGSSYEKLRVVLVGKFPRTEGGTQKINRVLLRKMVFDQAKLYG